MPYNYAALHRLQVKLSWHGNFGKGHEGEKKVGQFLSIEIYQPRWLSG